MTNQVIGYYTKRKEKLLNDFDTTSALMGASLIARYGEEFANTLQREARQQYEELIPEIPYIKGSRGRMLNTFLHVNLITAKRHQCLGAGLVDTG